MNYIGDTALHGAAYRGVPEVAEYLIQNGAKLDVTDARGLSPLIVASGVNYIDYFSGLSKSPKTAEVLRNAMKDRGLSTKVPPVDEKLCLYCYLSQPKSRAAARRRARELSEQFKEQQQDSLR